MKTLALLFLMFPAVGFCQGFLPRWEMSASFDANSYSSGNGQSQSYLAIEFQPGFYPVLGLGLSMEPQLSIGAAKGRPAAMNLGGALSYSFGMGYWPFVPFVEAGWGIGDGVLFSEPLTMWTYSHHITAIQFFEGGGGVKVMTFGGRCLLRVEYRYQSFSRFHTSAPISMHANNILFGFGVLL